MEESDKTFQIIGTPPDLAENSQVVFEDEIRVNSIVCFEKKDSGTTAVKLVDMENLDQYKEPVYRIGKGDTPGQIVFEQVEIGDLEEMLAEQNHLYELIDSTFDNLAFFYRDQDLSDDLIGKYYRGLIVQERGFVDASYQRGGLAARHRFLIASSQARDLSQMPGADPAQGLVVMINDSFFKVLDVTEKENRKQITLLHIPAELVDFFNSGDELNETERQIVEAARANFDSNFSAPPVDALSRADWLNRLTDAIGIGDDGEYFYAPTESNS